LGAFCISGEFSIFEGFFTFDASGLVAEWTFAKALLSEEVFPKHILDRGFVLRFTSMQSRTLKTKLRHENI
jgi:hypothetical protein